MGKRKIKGSDFNHFGAGDNDSRNRDEASYEDTNAAFFGQFMDVEAIKLLRVEAIDIFKIRPDFTQPRRTIPSVLRHGKRGLPLTMGTIFEEWIAVVNEERAKENYPPFNLREAIEMVETALPSPSVEHAQKYEEEHRLPRMWITDRGVRIDPRDLAKAGGIISDDGLRPELLEAPNSAELKVELSKFSAEAALMHIITLAASIRQHELTNAITVINFEKGKSYFIETGERRWMSYHLLHHVYGDDWKNIPARIVPYQNIWRQASENNARQDLNAIAKARQLAIIVMELYKELEFKFQPFEAFEHEKDYYAQVADGVQWRIIKGEMQRVLTFLGLSDPVQIRQYRALLRLDYELWDFADDNNISEFELREMTKSGFIPLGSPKQSGQSKQSILSEPEANLFSREWIKIANRQRSLAKKISPDDRKKMSVMLRSLADEIDKMK